jgi:undecaprenyl-diphosphatase
MRELLEAIDAYDRRLFERLTGRERRFADRWLKRLSTAANRSVLWLSLAAVIAIVGGHRGRKAARRGAVAIALTSTLVNLPLKYLARRGRPRIRRSERPMLVRMPASFSFPSGHSASAFAFATAIGLEDPPVLPLILPLAGGVAYSRVHLRVHYPLDVLVGGAIGAGMGLASGAVVHAARGWWSSMTPVPETQRLQTNRLVLVLSKGARKPERLDRARKAIRQLGLEIVKEIDVEDAARLHGAVQPDGRGPVIVAAGGDGTVGAVADLVAGTRAVMGVLPFGTSNDFARSIGIPMRTESAVRLLSRGPIVRVDAGRLVADDRPARHFVHAAAIGINVSFARFATRADFRERLGRLNYALAAARALQERKTFRCEIEFGGQRQQLELLHLAVVNTPVFGGFLDLRVPQVSPDDQKLEVIMVEHLPIRRLLRSAVYPAIGIRRRIRGFRTMAVSRLTVRSPGPMDVTLDGEVAGKVPGTFEVVPGALRVIAPARSAED